MRPVEIDDGQVRALPHFDRSDLRVETEGARPAKRGELEHLGRGQRLGAEARLLDQGGGPHFLERVQSIVARRAVGAEPHAAPRREHLGDRRDPAAELQIRAGTVNDVRVLTREAFDAFLVHPDAVRQRRARTRDAD